MLLSGIILKPRYEYIEGSFSVHQRHVISLLIHGFLPVNARLLIAFGTAFYAIIDFNKKPKKTDSVENLCLSI